MIPLGRLEIPEGSCSPATFSPGQQTWRTPEGIVWSKCSATPGQCTLEIPDLGTFFLDHDSRIHGEPSSKISREQLHRAFLAEALPLLHQANGAVCLHASALALGGGRSAVAFVGARGVGKSTLASTWESRRGELLADDVLVLYPRGHGFVVQPLPFTRRLREPTCRYLGARPRQHRPASPLRPTLKALFIVERAASPGELLEPLEPGEALATLLEQSLCFLLDSSKTKAAFFNSLADLLDRVPCWRLRNPGQLDHLPRVFEAIGHVVAP